MNSMTAVHRNKKNKTPGYGGFTLIESIVYIAVLVMTLLVVVFAVAGIGKSYARVRSHQILGRAAAFSLERLSREIRFASSVDTVQSSFGVSPGIVVLSFTNPARTLKVYAENGTLKMDEDGVYIGDLTSSKVYVSSFIVRRFQTGESEGIRIETTLQASDGKATTTESFYTTAVMRGSYSL